MLHEMQNCGLRPNPVTLSSVLLTISFHSNLWGAKQVHSYAISNDFDRNIYLATALIDAYAKSGHLCGAQRVFDGCKTRSVIVWTSIISAYSAHGIADAALTLFGEMLDARVRPDSVTITAVLTACAHAGAVDEARNVFDDMLSKQGIAPVLEHYACMVGVLSRAGLLQEAVEFVNVMPFEPNAKVWGSLLDGAAVFGDVELGKFVFDRLFETEPDNTGNYIVMANLYSKAGKWEEAKMMREKMRGVGLAKVTGCSWIEMTDGLKVFVACDMLTSCFEEMCMVIEGLLGLIREEGCGLQDELDEQSIDS